MSSNNEQIYIIKDTREKIGKKIEIDNYFQDHNIKVLRSKLPYGDYAIINRMNLVIDTKANFLELAGNLTKDHIRFRNEIKGANDFGIGIVILIEETDFYATLNTFKQWYRIPVWKSDGWKKVGERKVRTHRKGEPMTKVNVDAIVKAMITMQEKYAVIFKFTTKERCGADIINILHTRYDDYNNYFQNKLKKLKEINNE